VVSFDDLRSQAAARAPCITAGIAILDPLQLHARIQNLIRGIERHLKDAGVNSEKEFTLVQPIRTLANAIEEEHDWSIGLILYRSPDLFRHFWLRDTIEDFVTVSQTFQIRPLHSVVSKEQKFYVLALSQKHTRLLMYPYQEPAGAAIAAIGATKPAGLDEYTGTGPCPRQLVGRRPFGWKDEGSRVRHQLRSRAARGISQTLLQGNR